MYSKQEEKLNTKAGDTKTATSIPICLSYSYCKYVVFIKCLKTVVAFELC
jgi:hypothetical protein